jgi:hypothetical protein
VCWEEMSVNWRDGQPYDYCPEHGEPNAVITDPHPKKDSQ